MKKLGTLYRQYINIAQRYNLPIMLMIPTRKVNGEALKKSIYCNGDVIEDCCEFLMDNYLMEHLFQMRYVLLTEMWPLPPYAIWQTVYIRQT